MNCKEKIKRVGDLSPLLKRYLRIKTRLFSKGPWLKDKGQTLDQAIVEAETLLAETDTDEEKVQFIESMNAKQLENISNFFVNMPRLKHTINYTCKGCGQEDTVVLEGLADFF